MKWLQQLKAMVEAVWGFFPVQLLLAHLKRNIILLFLWFLLFGFTLGHIGKNYGISNLLLAPEYLGKVNFNSFLILGWAFGGFALSFQLLSYMIQSRFYPLIATFSRPFFKICFEQFSDSFGVFCCFCHSVSKLPTKTRVYRFASCLLEYCRFYCRLCHTLDFGFRILFHY